MNAFFKFFLLPFALCSCVSFAYTQNNKWLLGEWKGIGVIPGSDYSTVFLRTLQISIETKNRFSGLLTQELMNNKSIRIEKEISGTILNDQISLSTGRTLYKKQPLHGFWADCSACKMNSTRITVSSDSLILTNETRLCGNYCDGYATYYKPLADYDTATQRKLVQLFGSPLLVKIFKPVFRNNEALPRADIKSAPGSGTLQQHNGITDTNTRNYISSAEKRKETGYDTAQHQLSRKNKTIATYNVPDAGIKIELFDNGEIDGDTVTVYHNKQRIIDRQVLGLQPIVYSVKAGANDRVHEFILVANNLGRIPPNTALMRITAGSKTYELFASTNLTENASVIIIYSGK